MKGILLLVVLVLWLAQAEFVNEKITRMISLTQPNAVKTTVAFKISREKPSQQDNMYKIYLPNESFGGKIARMACTVEMGSNANAAKTTFYSRPDGHDDAPVEVHVVLPETFSSGTVTCTFVRVSAVSPLPKEILQTERQRMVFEGDFSKQLTPYTTKEEQTTVACPSKPDVLRPVSDCTVQNHKLLCVNPKESGQKLKLQFDSSQVYTQFTLVEREVELSHWGNVAVEEHFDLKNVGAKLKGGFSRLDHSRGNYVQDVKSFLPSSAFGVYYRDALGNVTSSHLRKERTRQVMEMKLRFPVYGGWHIDWYQGYNQPLETVVSKLSAGRYVVDIDAFHSVPLPAAKLVLHVVMPAGATDFKFELPPNAKVSEFRRYTYLDVPWSARRVVRIELDNVLGGDFQEAGTLPRTSEDRVRIYYQYDERLVMEKPLAVSAAILAVMLTWMGMGRMTK